MSRTAVVNTRYAAPRRLLSLLLLISTSVLHAAQPLTDQELKNRYLAYSAEDNEVIVVVRQATAPVERNPQLQLLSRTLRLIDRENTDNLLVMQDRQSLAVGAILGLQDTNREVLASQPAANFGSEPFSSRWSGNLDQIIEVSRISGFALYGINVELYNINGAVRIESQAF